MTDSVTGTADRPGPESSSLAGRLDGFQRRHPWAGFPIAVVYKYIDDSGGNLAALIAYYAFLSLFPLLLLLSTVLSLVLAGRPDLQQQLIDSALGQFPVVGDQLGEPRSLGGGTVGFVVGVLGALLGGLGVAVTLQYVSNTAWAVPKNERPDPVRMRLRGLLILGILGLSVVSTTALSSLGAGVGSIPGIGRALVLAASVALNSMVFILGFRLATARDLGIRDVAAGAVTAAVVWQLLQTFGVVYVGHVVNGSSASNAVFATVLGLVAFLYVVGVVVVLCTEINVVRVDKLYPRALLTPFVDDVDLTSGDKQVYTEQAQAQRSKGSQEIDVSFTDPDDPGRRGG